MRKVKKLLVEQIITIVTGYDEAEMRNVAKITSEIRKEANGDAIRALELTRSRIKELPPETAFIIGLAIGEITGANLFDKY